METVSSLLSELSETLREVSGDLALRDAETIFETVTNKKRHELYLNSSQKITSELADRIRQLSQKRKTGLPLPYVLNTAWFFGEQYTVTPDVLIPRPDTETLVDIVLKHETTEPRFFLELGIGSGIITNSLLVNRSTWRGIAVDISYKALLVARQNTPPETALLCADSLSAFKPSEAFDFFVSNPPYIPLTHKETLDDSVTGYEPDKALFGGDDGLSFYRLFATSLHSFLVPHGRIYLEIGWDQGETVTALFQNGLWDSISICKDLAGRDRVVTAKRKGQ